MSLVHFRDRRAADLMLMLSLNETIEQLTLANNVHWNDHVSKEG